MRKERIMGTALLESREGHVFRTFRFTRELLSGCAAVGILILLSFFASRAGANPARGKALQIYFVEVEGGQDTLFVTPEEKSRLIDPGSPEHNGRHADRFNAAAKL